MPENPYQSPKIEEAKHGIGPAVRVFLAKLPRVLFLLAMIGAGTIAGMFIVHQFRLRMF